MVDALDMNEGSNMSGEGVEDEFLAETLAEVAAELEEEMRVEEVCPSCRPRCPVQRHSPLAACACHSIA